jgi:pimeloyl-ACP methyl ester carboxylesterase
MTESDTLDPSVPYVEPRSITVAVAGGDLHALVWGQAPRLLMCLHGITANAVSIQPVADRLAEHFTVVAPDLRGRGRSARLPGPYGMGAHAADVIAVLDQLGVDRAALLGESMGGYVAVQTAVEYPDRVDRLHLIDGGLPLPIPAGLDADTVIAAVLGPALDRLRRTFSSRAEYYQFWREHPAFVDEDWTDYLERYLDADLTGSPPQLRSTVSEAAVLGDGRDQLVSDDLQRLGDITCPVSLVRAPRNLINEPTPLFPDAIVEQVRTSLPQIDDRIVEGVNHYTLFLTDRGADAIARAVLATSAA